MRPRAQRPADEGVFMTTDWSICRECDIHHVQNCPRCCGFGLKASGGIIAAEEAQAYQSLEYEPCPICKSTPFGVDSAQEALDDGTS